MPKQKKELQNGFTLVEIIVTIFVFAIILPAVAYMIVSLSVINDRARELSLVHSLAQNKIEELRSKGFIAVDGGGTFTNELPDTLPKPRSAEYAVGLVDPDDPSLKEITITVTYNDRGEARTLTYKSYLGELGVGQY